MSRARDLAGIFNLNPLSGTTAERPTTAEVGDIYYNGTIAKTQIYTPTGWQDMASGIPFGNTAGRPSSPSIGQPYFNGESQRLELYTGVQYGWQNIVAETPGITGYSGTVLESNTTNTINIVGTNFSSGAVATLIGTDGTEYNATTTTVSNLTLIQATFGQLPANKEPYDIRVTNPSNLYGVYYDVLTVNDTPAWTTTAGSLGSFEETSSVSVTVSATDEEGDAITYSVSSGSLPSGLSLNSSTGVISGTPSTVSADTNYSFTISATAGGQTSNRVFSITILEKGPVWVTLSNLGEIAEQASFSTQLSATDENSASITYSSSNMPAWASISSSGLITGTAPSYGGSNTYSFSVSASDGVKSTSRTFSYTVKQMPTAELLIVAGGGGGAGCISGHHEKGGGGGAGGLYINNSYKLSGSHLITVGNGGAGGPTGQMGFLGENSVFGNLIALGGGGGGGQNNNSAGNGLQGGSGGGQVGHSGVGKGTNTALQPTSATGGLGNSGGTTSSGNQGGGGGGGAGGVGANNNGLQGGNGGVGHSTSITGSSTHYAGGGGGGSEPGHSAGSGGNGGGGNGASGGQAGSGTPNTGGGGGGSGSSPAGQGGNGGSGIVVIAYPNTFPALSSIPGTLTYDTPTRSGYRVYRFLSGTGTVVL